MAEPRSSKSFSAPPTLSSLYSGVPERLASAAQEAKDKLLSKRTLPERAPRKRAVRLPPDVNQQTFDRAIRDLKKSLGEDNVILNDQPLADGWYMEHP